MKIGYVGGENLQIEVTEVGMRDGLQIERKIIPAAQKIALINKMMDAGIRNIEVTSFVSPRAVPQLADAEEVLAGVEKRADVCFSALVPNQRAARRAIRTCVDVGVVLCSASDTHNRKNLNRGTRDTLDGCQEVVQVLQQSGKIVHSAIATAFGCPFEGDVPVGRVLEIANAYASLGLRHLTLGDTTGMATPVNVRAIVHAIQKDLPQMEICLHLHNTRGIGLVNALAGLDLGVRHFETSVGGLGGCPFAAGATGNICTEDFLFLLQECGWETGIDLEMAIGLAHSMEHLLGKPLMGQVMRAGPRLRLHSVSDVESAAG